MARPPESQVTGHLRKKEPVDEAIHRLHCAPPGGERRDPLLDRLAMQPQVEPFDFRFLVDPQPAGQQPNHLEDAEGRG